MGDYWWVFTLTGVACTLLGWATDEEFFFPLGIALGCIGLGLCLA